LFRQANIIAGPSGGAFTNIVFCKAGTTILNFFHWQADNCFQKLCATSRLNYSYVASRPKMLEVISRKFGRLKVGGLDFEIGIADLKKTLGKIA
jgi:hypothetical protein